MNTTLKRNGTKSVQNYLQLLKKLNLYNGDLDGVWGRETQNAYLQGVQKKLIDPKTGKFILKNLNNSKNLSINLNTSLNINLNTNLNTNWNPDSTLNSVLNGKAFAYNDNKKRWDYVEDCARWANSALLEFNKRKTYGRYGVGGDAWTRNSEGNAVSVYSGYKNDVDLNKYKLALIDVDKFIAAEKNKKGSGKITKAMVAINEESNKRNHFAADNLKLNFNSKSLDKNQVYLVNMYYDKSPNKAIAFVKSKNGTTGTHTGNLYWNPSTNSWRVAHNIHGRILDDDWYSIQGSNNGYGYGATAIAKAYTAKDFTKREQEAYERGNQKARQLWSTQHEIKDWLRRTLGMFEDEYNSLKGTPIYINKLGGLFY